MTALRFVFTIQKNNNKNNNSNIYIISYSLLISRNDAIRMLPHAEKGGGLKRACLASIIKVAFISHPSVKARKLVLQSSWRNYLSLNLLRKIRK